MVATKRLVAVIEGIRALAKHESLAPINFCLNDLIDETLSLFKRELAHGHIDLNTNLSTPTVWIRADRGQIRQVLINLVVNAAQAMVQNDSPVRKLVVESTTGNGAVIISVPDTRPGVDLKLRDSLFSAFVMNKAEGMGLGLSLRASIIDRHGGQIWADFDQRAGSIFRFSPPLGSPVSLS